MIKHIRQAIGAKQQRVAADASIDHSMLSHIEHGRKPCSIELAVRLARALDHEPAVFVRALLQEWLDEAGGGLVVSVQPVEAVGVSGDARAAWELDQRTLDDSAKATHYA